MAERKPEENGASAGMASVREIARKTGLSAATVSRALKAHPDVSDETRSLVFDEAERMGYFSQPKRSRSAIVAPWQIGASIGYVAPVTPSSGNTTACS